MSVRTKYPPVLAEMSTGNEIKDVRGALKGEDNTGSGALLVRNVTQSRPYSLLYRYINRPTRIEISRYIQ